jgi:dTDP-4-amino-4,6-dideoxygalactose transaminase
MALGIGSGDEVITSSFTFAATAEAIALRGAKPVFVDIDHKTFNIDPDKIEAAITGKTKAIIPVHLYGQAAEMEKIMAIARKYKLYVVEDAAQAIGARHKGTAVGGFGDFGCLSFYPSKNLGACGDGGAVLTNDANLARSVKMFRVHGSKQRYHHEAVGVTSRLDAIQAVILSVKLKYLDGWTEIKREKAKIYDQGFGEIQKAAIPVIGENNSHVYHQYTIRAEDRNGLEKHLNENGVPTMIYYPIPLHLQPAFAYLGGKPGDLPQTESAAREVISLPIYAELTGQDQQTVIETVKIFFGTAQ